MYRLEQNHWHILHKYYMNYKVHIIKLEMLRTLDFWVINCDWSTQSLSSSKASERAGEYMTNCWSVMYFSSGVDEFSLAYSSYSVVFRAERTSCCIYTQCWPLTRSAYIYRIHMKQRFFIQIKSFGDYLILYTFFCISNPQSYVCCRTA